MSLLRCPKFLRCLTADAGNFDRGHSLTSLLLPLAALSSLPTASLRTGLAMTGFLQGVGARLGGSSGRPTPTHHSPIELRRGRRPRRPALPRARCALAMTGFYKGAVCGGTHGSRPTAGFCRARVLCRECGALSAGGQRRPPLRSATRSAVERADVGIGPYESVTRSAFGIGRAGKSAKRCQWQRKRAGFEEVP